MRLLTFLAVAVALSAGAVPAAADPRIQTRLFASDEVVTVHGHTGIQSTIAFDPDERIENVAVGDSAVWQVVPNKGADLLFAKPLKPSGRTNMTVVTDQRTYLFDLVAGPAGSAVYKLSFTYPFKPKPPAAPVQAAAADPAPPPAPAATPKPTEIAPADLNFAWDRHGAKQLLPDRSFDDGRAVYLSWPQGVALPAILVRSPSGAEGPVNYTVKGAYVVVDGVPGQIILRSGKQVATLTWEASGSAAATAVQTARRPPPPSLPMAGSVPTPIRLPSDESAMR